MPDPPSTPTPRKIQFADVNSTDLDGHVDLYAQNSSTNVDWRPDAGKVVFSSVVSPTEAKIVTVVVSTGVSSTLTSGNNDKLPVWSLPDPPAGGGSARILFRRANGAINAIWIMNEDGTGQTQVSTQAVDHDQPQFDPTTKTRAVYQRKDANGFWQLVVNDSLPVS